MIVRCGCSLWLMGVLSASAAAASPPDPDTQAAALARCEALAPARRAACFEAVMRPSPEVQANMELVQRTSSAYHRRVADLLAATGRPRELAFAAMLRQMAAWSPTTPDRAVPSDPLVPGLRERALATAGNDVLALTLLAQADGLQERGRTGATAVVRWQQLEPGNLAPWLYDAMPPEALLQGAATFNRYDSYAYPRVRWIAEVLTRHPPTAEEQRILLDVPPRTTAPRSWEEAAALQALGIDMAVALPGLQFAESCRGDALRMIGRRERCRRLAELLADGSDSMIMEAIGIGILKRLAQTTTEHAHADARRRQLDWQRYQYVVLERRSGYTQFVRYLRDPSVPNERELFRRLFLAQGIPLEPPPGWRPPPVQDWVR